MYGPNLFDTEWSKVLRTSCKHVHNSCSCCSNVFSWIFHDICLYVLSEGFIFWCNHFLYFSIRKKVPGHTEMGMMRAFLMQSCYILCHCVSAPRLWRNWGVCSVFPHWDECVWVEGKSLAVGSVGLSSSSLSVGQEDRDGFLSAGLWLDPSPQLPCSTHTSNWSWQEVGMRPSLAPSLLLLFHCPFFDFLF